MERADLKILPLAIVGLAQGAFNYYVRPIPSDMAKWIVGRLISFETPTQESIDDHIEQVVRSTQL